MPTFVRFVRPRWEADLPARGCWAPQRSRQSDRLRSSQWNLAFGKTHALGKWSRLFRDYTKGVSSANSNSRCRFRSIIAGYCRGPGIWHYPHRIPSPTQDERLLSSTAHYRLKAAFKICLTDELIVNLAILNLSLTTVLIIELPIANSLPP